MPELPHPARLPDRPDLHQIRRQARELQRAAAAGEPEALRRLRAVSSEATLTAAQLAIARELGFPSWTKLREEVLRRRAETPGPSIAALRSFGGGRALPLEGGVLSAAVLLVDGPHAVLEGRFIPSGPLRMGPPSSWQRLVMHLPVAPRLLGMDPRTLPVMSLRGLRAVDDQGAVYAVRPRSGSGSTRHESRTRVIDTAYVVASVDPAPPAGLSWLELRSAGGAASRLMPARRASFALGGGPSPAHGRGGGFGEELAPSDLAAELPTLDGTTARVDCLVPSDDSWRLHLSVRPHFWRSVEGGERVAALGITAEDDLGGAYTHTLAGNRRGGGPRVPAPPGSPGQSADPADPLSAEGGDGAHCRRRATVLRRLGAVIPVCPGPAPGGAGPGQTLRHPS